MDRLYLSSLELQRHVLVIAKRKRWARRQGACLLVVHSDRDGGYARGQRRTEKAHNVFPQSPLDRLRACNPTRNISFPGTSLISLINPHWSPLSFDKVDSDPDSNMAPLQKKYKLVAFCLAPMQVPYAYNQNINVRISISWSRFPLSSFSQISWWLGWFLSRLQIKSKQ